MLSLWCERERDMRERRERRESVSFYEYNTHQDCYIRALYIRLYCSILCLGIHIGNLLWDSFCDFLDLFPIHREQTPL
jgi:hypothetical protein